MRPAVLIVEDVDSCNAALSIAIQGFLGLDVHSASNGVDGWRCLDEDNGTNIRAVLTDLHMPGMDGYGLLARIRSDQRFHRLPVIVISGTTDPSAPEEVIAAGADAYFEKPYSPATVRAKLERLLYEKHQLPS